MQGSVKEKRNKKKGKKRVVMSEEEKHELYDKIMSACLSLKSVEYIEKNILNDTNTDDFKLSDVKSVTPLTNTPTELSLLAALLLQGKLNSTAAAATTTAGESEENKSKEEKNVEDEVNNNNNKNNNSSKDDENEDESAILSNNAKSNQTSAQELLQWLIDHNADINELVQLPIDTSLLSSSELPKQTWLQEEENKQHEQEEHHLHGQRRQEQSIASELANSKNLREGKLKTNDVSNVNTTSATMATNTSKQAMTSNKNNVSGHGEMLDSSNYNNNNENNEESIYNFDDDDEEKESKVDKGTLLHYVICAHDNARLLQLLTLAGHKIYSQTSLTDTLDDKVNTKDDVNNSKVNHVNTLEKDDNENSSVHFIDVNDAAMQTKNVPYSLYSIIKTNMAIAQRRKDLMDQLNLQSKTIISNNNTTTSASASMENDAKVFSRSNSMSRGNRKASASASKSRVALENSGPANANNTISRHSSSSRLSSRDERKRRTASGSTNAAMMQKQQAMNESKLNKLNALCVEELQSWLPRLESEAELIAQFNLWRYNSSSLNTVYDNDLESDHIKGERNEFETNNNIECSRNDDNKSNNMYKNENENATVEIEKAGECNLIENELVNHRSTTTNISTIKAQKKYMVLFDLEAQTTLTHLTPLQLAHKLHNRVAVQLLSFYGACNTLKSDYNGLQTELAYAVSSGDVTYVDELLNFGSGVNDYDLHAISHDGRYSLIHYAVAHPRMLSYLTQQHGLSIDTVNQFGESALVSLIRHGVYRNAEEAIKESPSLTHSEQLQALPRSVVDNYILMPLPAIGDSLNIMPGMKGNLSSNVANKGRNNVNSNNNNINMTIGRRKSSPHQSVQTTSTLSRKNDSVDLNNNNNYYNKNNNIVTDGNVNSYIGKTPSRKSNLQINPDKNATLECDTHDESCDEMTNPIHWVGTGVEGDRWWYFTQLPTATLIQNVIEAGAHVNYCPDARSGVNVIAPNKDQLEQTGINDEEDDNEEEEENGEGKEEDDENEVCNTALQFWYASLCTLPSELQQLCPTNCLGKLFHVNSLELDEAWTNNATKFASLYGNSRIANDVELSKSRYDTSEINKMIDANLQTSHLLQSLDAHNTHIPILPISSTPLQHAIRTYHPELIRKMVMEYQAQIMQQDSSGANALHYAALARNKSVMEFLLTSPQIKRGLTSLTNPNTNATSSTLTMNMSNPNKNKNVNNLHSTSNTNKEKENATMEDLQMQSEEDAIDINATDIAGATPLLYACSKGNTEVVKVLIRLVGSQLEMGKADHNGLTPLLAAVEVNAIEIVQVLLDHSAQLNQAMQSLTLTQSPNITIGEFSTGNNNLLGKRSSSHNLHSFSSSAESGGLGLSSSTLLSHHRRNVNNTNATTTTTSSTLLSASRHKGNRANENKAITSTSSPTSVSNVVSNKRKPSSSSLKSILHSSLPSPPPPSQSLARRHNLSQSQGPMQTSKNKVTTNAANSPEEMSWLQSAAEDVHALRLINLEAEDHIYHYTPLECAIKKNKSTYIAQVLLTHGASPQRPSGLASGGHLLHYAVVHEQYDVVKLLLTSAACALSIITIDDTDDNDYTSLHLAVSAAHVHEEMVHLLVVEHHASFLIQSVFDLQSPLLIAGQVGLTSVLELFLFGVNLTKEINNNSKDDNHKNGTNKEKVEQKQEIVEEKEEKDWECMQRYYSRFDSNEMATCCKTWNNYHNSYTIQDVFDSHLYKVMVNTSLQFPLHTYLSQRDCNGHNLLHLLCMQVDVKKQEELFPLTAYLLMQCVTNNSNDKSENVVSENDECNEDDECSNENKQTTKGRVSGASASWWCVLDNERHTLLHLCCQSLNVQVVQLLLWPFLLANTHDIKKESVNVEALDLYSNNKPELQKYVAEMMFSVDVFENTVLHATVHAVMATPQSEKNACNIVQLLHDAFCNTTCKDNAISHKKINENKSVLYCSEAETRDSCEQYKETWREYNMRTDNQGRTAFMLAAEFGHVNLARRLLHLSNN